MMKEAMKVLLFGAFCFTIMSALMLCHDAGLNKIEPIEEAYADEEQVVEETEKTAENEEQSLTDPYRVDYQTGMGAELEDYTVEVAESYGLAPEILFGIMYVETRYDADAVGDNGNSLGLMQIQPRWNQERMEKLGVTDLLDPYQNILCGADILAEILESGCSMEKALVIYNMGEQGAKGIESTEYSQAVLRKAVELI